MSLADGDGADGVEGRQADHARSAYHRRQTRADGVALAHDAEAAEAHGVPSPASWPLGSCAPRAALRVAEREGVSLELFEARDRSAMGAICLGHFECFRAWCDAGAATGAVKRLSRKSVWAAGFAASPVPSQCRWLGGSSIVLVSRRYRCRVGEDANSANLSLPNSDVIQTTQCAT